MPIDTGVSSLLARPQSFHAFTYSFAVGALQPIPLRLAIIGTMRSTGTAVAGTVYEPASAAHADTLFGVGSEAALMYRQALIVAARAGKGPRIFVVGVTEPGAGTANVKTLTAVGTATADGNIIIRVAGRTVTVGVRIGDLQNTIATNIANALKAIQENLPTIVTVATNVVTLTHAAKGINGTDVQVSIDQQVAGCVVTLANTVVGAGVADHQTALDALAPMPMDALAFANHYAADITEINADAAARWNYAEKRWRWYFLGEPGTIGTATTLATAANHQAVVVGSYEGCLNTAGEIAAALACSFLARERPNANYDNMPVPLYAPPVATIYTPTEVETAIAAGLTPITAAVDPFTRQVSSSLSRIERLVTTKTTQGGQPFLVLRDIGVARVGVYLAQQYDIAYAARFSGDADPDGTLLSDDVIGQVKDMIEGINRQAQDANIIRNVDVDLARLRVERDDTVSGRLNVDNSYTVVVGLHQIAYAHRVQV